MNLTEFLDTTLIESEDFKFTVFNLVLIIFILVVARLLSWGVTRLLRRTLRRRKGHAPGRRYAIISISRYGIFTLAILLILANSGLNITVIVAGSTALLVGLGFGLQNLFKDFVGGIILLFEGSIEVNDIVEVNNIVGRVKLIGLRTSHILTQDGISIIVPNSKFVEENVTNLSTQHELSRFHVRTFVAYGSDPNQVREVLLAIAVEDPRVEGSPVPTVRLTDFGDSSLEFELLFWTRKNFEQDDIKSDLRFRMFEAFGEAGIQIPFPQQDIYVKELPGKLES